MAAVITQDYVAVVKHKGFCKPKSLHFCFKLAHFIFPHFFSSVDVSCVSTTFGAFYLELQWMDIQINLLPLPGRIWGMKLKDMYRLCYKSRRWNTTLGHGCLCCGNYKKVIGFSCWRSKWLWMCIYKYVCMWTWRKKWKQDQQFA